MEKRLIEKFEESNNVSMVSFLANEKVPEGMTFVEAFYAYMKCMHEVEGTNFYAKNIYGDISDIVTDRYNP